MDALPIQIRPSGKPALIVGAAPCAADVVTTLRRAGWPVRVLADELSPTLRRLLAGGLFEWHTRVANATDIQAAALVFAAANNAEANARTKRLAADQACLFCDLTGGKGDFDLAAATLPPPADPWYQNQVCLVGAGPGDPGLLTRHGARALAGADVVLHDRLVTAAMLACIPAGAERVFVGKRRDHHHYRQDELNELMTERARAGQRVLRLKGGDPFMFGRGGEELLALARAGIATRVIPGVTAGSGVATYADIPLTHRGYASSCQFITAYDRNGLSAYDWASLVRERHTLVVYMGVSALRSLCPKLVDHGMAADMPAALIECGTRADQRVMTGTISTLPAIASQQQLRSPAVLIIGEVVTLRAAIAGHGGEQPGSAHA